VLGTGSGSSVLILSTIPSFHTEIGSATSIDVTNWKRAGGPLAISKKNSEQTVKVLERLVRRVEILTEHYKATLPREQ
jgi:hypothetical protein